MVHLGTATTRTLDGQTLIEVEMRRAERETLWFRMPEDLTPSPEAIADALFPIGLLLAMTGDGVLELEAPVSSRLLAQQESIQDILLAWHGPKLTRATLAVTARPDEQVERPTGAAACFTGGVDSFYTFVKNRDRVTSLVYVHGFDIPLDRQDLYDQASAHLREVSAETGVRLIELATNLKPFFAGVSWGKIVHGPALATIGMLLGRTHGTFLIPASHSYADLFPWGSHPVLDHRWSTERIEVVHDRPATRVHKTVAIAQDETAQRHLRVCWKNTGAYNCSVCEKCYRTKTCLYLAGTLDKFRTFDGIVDPEVLRAQRIANENALSFTVENRDFAREVGDEVVAGAIDEAIAAFRRRSSGSPEVAKENRILARENAKLKKSLDTLNSRKAVRLANGLRDAIAPVRRLLGSSR